MRYRVSFEKISIVSYFVSVIVIGTVLLSLPLAWNGPGRLSILDAAFTATSAVCVTGLATVDTALYSRFGQVVLMLLIQFGGLGIVTFATLYVALPRKKVSLVNSGIIKEMYVDEVNTDPRSIVRTIVLTTLSFELLGFIALATRFSMESVPGTSFQAAFLAVSAFCNAGFSPFSDSLGSFRNDPVVNAVIMSLVVSGGIGFVVMQDVGRVFMRRKRRLTYHTKIVLITTSVLIAAGGIAFLALEAKHAYGAFSLPEKALSALFQSVTTRTAGFDTVPQSSLSLASIVVVIALMFTGGSPGSTAGGVKTTTIFIAFAAAFRGYEDDGTIMYRGGSLSAGSVAKAFSIIAKAAVTIAASLLAVLAIEHGRMDFGDLFFEVVSAFGTVGLSRGVTASLLPASKVVVIATMFIGRVGLFAMAISRPLDRVERFAEYPYESLLLG